MSYRRVEILAARECINELLDMVPKDPAVAEMITHGKIVLKGITDIINALYSIDASDIIATEFGPFSLEQQAYLREAFIDHQGFQSFIRENAVWRSMIERQPVTGTLDELIERTDSMVDKLYLWLLRESRFLHPLIAHFSEMVDGASWELNKAVLSAELEWDILDTLSVLTREVIIRRPELFQTSRHWSYEIFDSVTSPRRSFSGILESTWLKLRLLDVANGSHARLDCMPWEHAAFRARLGDMKREDIDDTDDFDRGIIFDGLDLVESETGTARTNFFKCIIDKITNGEISTDMIIDDSEVRSSVELMLFEKVRFVTSPIAVIVGEYRSTGQPGDIAGL